MLKKIIIPYLILFLSFFLAYSFLNWFLTEKTGVITIDDKYSNFWIPFSIVYVPIFFVIRPLLKKSGFRPKIMNSLLWVLLPFSISIPTVASQQYFKNISYNIIRVQTPDDVLLYPKEKFFIINKFRTNHNFFTLYKERHVSGFRSKTLKLNNYYIAPIISNNVSPLGKVAYGIKFSESLNHGLLFRKNNAKKIDEFNKKTDERFLNYDLYKVTFFEKQVNSEDAKNFAEAWRKNRLLNQEVEPIVLVNKQKTIKQFYTDGRNITLLTSLISLIITISLLAIFSQKNNP